MLNKKIKELHDRAENTVFAQRLATGVITATQYANYVYSMSSLFECMEESVDFDIPSVDLHRSLIARKTLEELQHNYGPLNIYTLDSVEEYRYYIMGCREEKKVCNSHIYLNYMPLLMGGSIIKTKIPFASSLYLFESRSQCVAAIRSLEIDEEQVATGFEFHIRIMEELEEKTKNDIA